jgi:hypothetical protein
VILAARIKYPACGTFFGRITPGLLKRIKMEFKPQDFGANLYSEQRVASYFYRVIQDVAAFKDKEVVNSYHHVEDFKDADLRKARQEAIEYLTEQYLTLPEGFIFPYLSPEQHAANPDEAFSAYSHSILFVEFYNDEIFEEWPIAGEEEEDIREGLEHEAAIWLKNEMGEPPHITRVI